MVVKGLDCVMVGPTPKKIGAGKGLSKEGVFFLP